jgi:peptidoglycan/xylan/chitin deacetylase (PgdA/CDA1 family)
MTTASLKRAVAWGLLRSGALRLHQYGFGQGRAILLVYHRVNDEGNPFFPALPRETFAEQLAYLATAYRVQPLEDVIAWLGAGAVGPPRVAITIDDGYPDTVEVVLPELSRHGLPATLFLSTGPLETGTALWIDRVRWMLEHARAPAFDLPRLGIARHSIATAGERLAVIPGLLRRLKALGPEEVDAAMRELESALDPHGPPLRLLRWDDARRLVQGPVRLGGHTHLHYMVSRLDDRTLEAEIVDSAALIRERVGMPVRTFAYPNGEAADYDERAVAVLRRAGFVGAVTARNDFARPGLDPFQLPRLYTKAPSLAIFAARLAGLGHQDTVAARVS